MTEREIDIQLVSAFETVDDNILIEFFLALPKPKFVARCKLVSKHWYYLISNLNFISRFVTRRIHQNSDSSCEYQDASTIILSYQNPQHRHSLFIPSKDPCFNSTGFTFKYLPEDDGSVRVLGSSRDLLLCCANTTDSCKFYICNPFTFHWLPLPSPAKNYCCGHTRVGFICEPYYFRAVQGDVYSVNDDYRYRVVCFNEVGKDNLMVAIFCSETGKWDESVLIGTQHECFSNVVAHNGKLHWYNGVNVVAYDPFNGGQSHFIHGSSFKPPEQIPIGCFYGYCLGVCQGHLRIMQLVTYVYGDAVDSSTLSIWELIEYSSGKWNLEHKISLAAMTSKNSWVQKFLKGGMVTAKALAFDPTNRDIVYLGFNDRIISCNLPRGQLNVAGKIPNESHFYNCDNVFPILLPWWPTPVHRNTLP